MNERISKSDIHWVNKEAADLMNQLDAFSVEAFVSGWEEIDAYRFRDPAIAAAKRYERKHPAVPVRVVERRQ